MRREQDGSVPKCTKRRERSQKQSPRQRNGNPRERSKGHEAEKENSQKKSPRQRNRRGSQIQREQDGSDPIDGRGQRVFTKQIEREKRERNAHPTGTGREQFRRQAVDI